MNRLKAIVKSVLLKIHGDFAIDFWHSYLQKYSLWRYRWLHRKEFLKAWYEQNKYDKSELRCKTIVVFVLYGKMRVNGGFMSIFNIAATSREVLVDAGVALCTGPGNPDIFSRNTLFPNKEKVWRWKQVRSVVNRNVEQLVLHLPECFVCDFLHNLSAKDRAFLKSVPNLRINIMNQNNLLMPSRDVFRGLYEFTDKVTQTTAHGKYNSQVMSDKYSLPTMRIGTYMSYDAYKRYDWDEKEQIIAYSPDKHPMKDDILMTLKSSFPKYLFVEIRDITFMEYMDLIARAMAVITFGEGLDGYFSQPALVGTLSFAVYNTDFFSESQDWQMLPNLFKSYEEMKEQISDFILRTVASESEYYSCVAALKSILVSGRTTREQYKERIRRFYAGDFDYYPNRKTKC